MQAIRLTSGLVLLLVASLAAQPGALPQLTDAVKSNQHLQDGLVAYSRHDYKKAIPALKAALEDLKDEPGFELSTPWRVVVDSLGMAYGISGDLRNAKTIFDYGVSKDPTYPMFHYNLACTFAEMRDRDRAIAELKEAFKFKSNANPAEPMPNPATDDSFTRFLKDKTFLAALDEIQKADRMFPDRLDFSISRAPWALTVPAEGFRVSQNRRSSDGKEAYFLFSNEKTGITASIYIEPAVKCTDSPSCRDFVRRAQLAQTQGAENVSSAEIGTTSVFEYFLPSFQGIPVRQHNMFAEFVQDGVWVDLHISKAAYTEGDRPLFEGLVRSVTFEKKP
jgi:tetratricopeptide (TPR) repeat protein